MLHSPFTFLSSIEAETPTGIYGWAKRVVEIMQRWRLTDLIDQPLPGNELKVIRVRADAGGYEYADQPVMPEIPPPQLPTDLTGKAGYTVKVKADETGYELVLVP